MEMPEAGSPLSPARPRFMTGRPQSHLRWVVAGPWVAECTELLQHLLRPKRRLDLSVPGEL